MKTIYEEVFKVINKRCKDDNKKLRVYIFGGQALILRGILNRPTLDIDIFTRSKKTEVLEGIKTLFKKDHGVEFDIGYEGQFVIADGPLTWTLPRSAYKDAFLYWKGSNLIVKLLDPKDVWVLKSYRMDEKDLKDMEAIAKAVKKGAIKFTREELIDKFIDYFKLIRGNKTSKSQVKENFENLGLIIFDKFSQ